MFEGFVFEILRLNVSFWMKGGDPRGHVDMVSRAANTTKTVDANELFVIKTAVGLLEDDVFFRRNFSELDISWHVRFSLFSI